jgi:hypothetical protein
VTDLLYRLGACLDEHRFAALDDVLTGDVRARTPGGEATGRQAVIVQATRNHAAFHGLQHLITNVLVELAGDEAAARANVVATFVGEGARPVRRVGGVYRFGLRRTGVGWRISDLAVDQVWRIEADTAAQA